jgi:type II secretory pathway pseudopilin PulG
MKLRSLQDNRAAAFTMVELALCVAIVAIAMVAIIGVLPAGLNVQRQSREEALLTQDAELLMGALRAGNISASELTNYVERITITRRQLNGAPVVQRFHTSIVQPPPAGSFEITEPFQIIGLVSRPKYTRDFNGPGGLAITTNLIQIQMRGISGSMSDKPVSVPGRAVTLGAERNDFAFRYLVTVEIGTGDVMGVRSWPGQPVAALGNQVPQPGVLAPEGNALPVGAGVPPGTAVVTDIRLIYEWPLIPSANPARPDDVRLGPNRRVFATQVPGRPQSLLIDNRTGNSQVGPVAFPRNQDGVGRMNLYRIVPGSL